MTEAGEFWIKADWPVPRHVHAGTSLRKHGFSGGHYTSLNLAAHVGDNEKLVKQNRALLGEKLALPATPSWLTQVHGNRIITLANAVPENPTADGSVTNAEKKVCAVLTADCVPLLFCNEAGNQVAAIHAGWRGICRGIIDRAVALYSEPEKLLVWIGPCIRKDFYEVGKDVFTASINYAENMVETFEQTDANHWQCDLAGMAKLRLQSAGVKQIYDSGLCTYANPDLFYSYRRDGETGRTSSLIWME